MCIGIPTFAEFNPSRHHDFGSLAFGIIGKNIVDFRAFATAAQMAISVV
jgi:hypothetical protein